MKRLALLIGLFFSVFITFGQANVLTYQEFLKELFKYHPIIRQASVRVEQSDAFVDLQRAVMDPTLEASYNDKAYDNKDYYTKSTVQLNLPTALGLEFYAGYAENTGLQIDPEILTSNSGMYQAGVKIPIGPELLFNERMLAIRQAELMVDMAKLEQRKLINSTLYMASLAYLNWSLAQASKLVQDEALELAENQFSFVREVYLGGDRPAIDTLESFLQVQLRRFQLLEAERSEQSARILLSNYLWDQEGNNIRLSPALNAQPLVDYTSWLQVLEDSFLIWQEGLLSNHPSILQTYLSLESLRLERQTAMSSALPKIDLKYAALSPGISNRDIQALGLDDRMLGIGLSYPLLMRSARSKLNLNSLKTSDNQFNLSNQSALIYNQFQEQLIAYRVSRDQAVLYISMVANHDRMLSAERTRFTLGESSVFLVNTRENSLIQAQLKQIETEAKQIGAALKIIQTTNRESAYIP